MRCNGVKIVKIFKKKNENFPRKLRCEITFSERTVNDKIGIY